MKMLKTKSFLKDDRFSYFQISKCEILFLYVHAGQIRKINSHVEDLISRGKNKKQLKLVQTEVCLVFVSCI